MLQLGLHIEWIFSRIVTSSFPAVDSVNKTKHFEIGLHDLKFLSRFTGAGYLG